MVRFVTVVLQSLFCLCVVSAQANAQQQPSIFLEYSCDIEGQTGRMNAEVIIIWKTGAVMKGGVGSVWAVLSEGTASLMYGGQLTTPSAQYAFTGYDDFADFTDMTNYAQFRVKFDAVGTDLLLTVNPFGPGPVQYRCKFVSQSGGGQPGAPGQPQGGQPDSGQQQRPVPYGPGAAPLPPPTNQIFPYQ